MHLLCLQLIDLQKQKKVAAKTGLRRKVEQVTQNIDSYTVEKTKFEQKLRHARDSLRSLVEKLEEVDKRVKQLQSWGQVKLDRLEDRCKFVGLWPVWIIRKK